jgi:hypothetical protein
MGQILTPWDRIHRRIMNLETLVNIAQEGPWCGIRPPGHPALHPSLKAAWDKLGSRPELRRHHADAFSHEVFGPEPDPWRLGAVEVGLYGAIALHQMAQRLSGGAADSVRSAALAVFDDTCSAVSPSELIWLLLHRPPPPMPRWLSALVFAGDMLGFAQATQQIESAAAASREISRQLEECGLLVQGGDRVAA